MVHYLWPLILIVTQQYLLTCIVSIPASSVARTLASMKWKGTPYYAHLEYNDKKDPTYDRICSYSTSATIARGTTSCNTGPLASINFVALCTTIICQLGVYLCICYSKFLLWFAVPACIFWLAKRILRVESFSSARVAFQKC